MAQDYLTVDDMSLRLSNSICFWDDKPVYVQVRTYPKVRIYKLDGKLRDYQEVDHRDDRFSDRSPSLGYMKYENEAVYLKRTAQRHQNQGLRMENISMLPSRLDNGDNYLIRPAMESCILGHHEPLHNALALLRPGPRMGVPIHRHVALKAIDSRRIGLYYRERLMAMYNGNTFDWLPGKDTEIIRKLVEKTGCLNA